MTGAIALYERLGYQRAPEFDLHWATYYKRSDAAPITSFAYLRFLTEMGEGDHGTRHARRSAKPIQPSEANSRSHPTEVSMTTRTRNRRASGPAYYLGRPAALWLSALAGRSAARTSPSVPCPGKADCGARNAHPELVRQAS
jgi:hypothetical protein